MKLADRGQAKRAGVDGLLVGLDRADARTETGNVAVSLDYGAIEQAYGGGWASRLQLVAMPACALTTPQLAACRTRTPIEAVNDPVNRKLSGTVALAATGSGTAKAGSAFAAPAAAAAAQSSGGVAVAAVAGTSGSQGDYGATSLSASGAWSASASGAFTYRYPITAPRRWAVRRRPSGSPTTRSPWTARPRRATRSPPGSVTAGPTAPASSSAPTRAARTRASRTPVTPAGPAGTPRSRSAVTTASCCGTRTVPTTSRPTTARRSSG
ncbi:hypothetical protein ACFQ0M_39350 [Kitasatospora aburaviensis]